MIKYLLLVIISALIGACSHHDSPAKTAINVEIIGSWANDSGCAAVFNKIDNKLILINFTNGRGHDLSNLQLATKKESIMSTFKSQNLQINFSGNFLEGMIIINDFCTEPLHKVDKQ